MTSQTTQERLDDIGYDRDALWERRLERRQMKRWAESVYEGLREYASHLTYVSEPKRRRRR